MFWNTFLTCNNLDITNLGLNWLANDAKMFYNKRRNGILNNLSENLTKLAQQTELQLAVVLALREHAETLRSLFRSTGRFTGG